jgi:uncharacterized protein YkwD
VSRRLTLIAALLVGCCGFSLLSWGVYSYLAPGPRASRVISDPPVLIVEEGNTTEPSTNPSTNTSANPAAPASGAGSPATGATGSIPVTSGVTSQTLPKNATVDLIERVNAERTAFGSALLTEDPVLSKYAEAWAREMSSSGYQHSSKERLGEILVAASLASVSENIHAPEPQCPLSASCSEPAFQPTTGVLHVDWMNSGSHRATALQPAWSKVGVGVVCDSGGRMWAVMLFGSAPGTTRDPSFSPALPELRRPDNDGVLCDGSTRETNPTWKHTPPG